MHERADRNEPLERKQRKDDKPHEHRTDKHRRERFLCKVKRDADISCRSYDAEDKTETDTVCDTRWNRPKKIRNVCASEICRRRSDFSRCEGKYRYDDAEEDNESYDERYTLL